MFRTVTAAVLAATLAGAVAAPAEARHHYGYGDRYGYGQDYGRGYYRPSRYQRHNGWGTDRYGYACHDKGNGGLAIGAIGGGVLGNVIAGHGDRTLGTVLGAVGGGLVGRSIDRHDGRC